MDIIEKLLTINPFSRPGIKLKSVKNIVLHWIGNAGSSALANRNYFESLKDKGIYASAHYILGLDGEKINCIPEDEMAYHSGNWNMNCNSIGIENCHPDWGGKFNDKTYNSLIELLVYLCRKYNLNQDAIIRHYDVTGKVCPKYYVEHQDAFEQLKADVASKLGNNYTPQLVQSTPTDNNNYDTYKVTYNGTNVRAGASLSSTVLYQRNSGDIIYVVGSDNGFYRLSDGAYIRMGYAYKVSTGVQTGSNYRVLYNGTNIRTAPTLKASVAYQKNSGNIVTVVGTSGDFYKLSDGNYLRIGYAEAINRNDNISNTTKYSVNAEYPNIRARANLNSKVVRLAKKGEIINVIGSENGFLKLSDGTYLKEGFADKI
nr:MAG TPA: N-acetylmuramoyl-L-alanine amidase [Caudoviricetes sp.]